jgi:DNA uptake protein ComE-like DNA-binding protein
MKALLAAVFAGVLSVAAPALAAAPTAQVLVAQAKTDLIDINRAKAEELMTLKGIGEARAAAIIKGRPYARKDELVQKKIIPESVYNEIKDRIIAKQ